MAKATSKRQLDSRQVIFVDARFRRELKGGDRCRLELARNLARQGSNFKFLAYDETAEVVRTVVGGCDVISTARRPWKHPRGDFYEHVQLPLLSRRIRADVYHGTFNVLPCMPALSPAPKSVVTIHDVAVYKMPEAYSRQFCILSRFLLSRAVYLADRIITVSSATRSDLCQLFPAAEAKTTVILNGVGDEFLNAADLPSNVILQVIQRLQLPPSYVLYVGNLERKKNLPRLIEAFSRAKAACDLPHRLVIVGERPSGVPDAGVADAIDGGLVAFTGFLPDQDLPAVYRGADLVAYPSLYEGFGMPVLEGLAAGVPVLTSDLSSMPEVAGGAAQLVDPHSVESIGAGIIRALTDEGWRRQAVARGRKHAATLSWEKNAALTVGVYQELLSN